MEATKVLGVPHPAVQHNNLKRGLITPAMLSHFVDFEAAMLQATHVNGRDW